LNNNFYKNKAENGGVLYFGNENDSQNSIIEKREITLNNNKFMNNEAKYFGGVIYSELEKINLFKEENNSIINNKAGINGGGIYISKLDNINSFNFTSSEMLNNTSNGINEDYAAKPSYVLLDTTIEDNKLSIYSGEYLSLTLSLYDAYDKFMNDITNYYSTLSLTISLKEKEPSYHNSTINEKIEYKLTENIVSLSRGKKKHYK